MVVRGHPSLSLTRQCRLLSIGRSSLYDRPKGESAETLALMRRIDALFLKYPFYGARQMVRHLRREGVRIGRRRAARLMRLLGLQAVYRAPRTSAPHLGHRVYPYLLRGLAIERPNHVWCADITYIPVRRGFLYLVAIMDWASRCVLAWRLSNTLDAGFCVEALDEALARHGTPQIFNTDQGSQFTGFAFTARLREAGIRISMDGRGRCMDNIFIERLWRSLKYEAVYLHEIADGFAARRVIGQWIGFYNTERPHSALGGRTPAEAYRGDTPVDMMDKPLRALTTYPQAQQQQQKDRSKRILAAQTSTGIHLENAVSLSDKPTPPQEPGDNSAFSAARTTASHSFCVNRIERWKLLVAIVISPVRAFPRPLRKRDTGRFRTATACFLVHWPRVTAGGTLVFFPSPVALRTALWSIHVKHDENTSHNSRGLRMTQSEPHVPIMVLAPSGASRAPESTDVHPCRICAPGALGVTN